MFVLGYDTFWSSVLLLLLLSAFGKCVTVLKKTSVM